MNVLVCEDFEPLFMEMSFNLMSLMYFSNRNTSFDEASVWSDAVWSSFDMEIPDGI